MTHTTTTPGLTAGELDVLAAELTEQGRPIEAAFAVRRITLPPMPAEQLENLRQSWFAGAQAGLDGAIDRDPGPGETGMADVLRAELRRFANSDPIHQPAQGRA